MEAQVSELTGRLAKHEKTFSVIFMLVKCSIRAIQKIFISLSLWMESGYFSMGRVTGCRSLIIKIEVFSIPLMMGAHI